MTPHQHQLMATRRADLRVARKAKLEHGVPVQLTLKALTRRRADLRSRKPARDPVETTTLRYTKGMNEWVHDKLQGLDHRTMRYASARALDAVLARYNISRLFDPLDDLSWGEWRQRTRRALVYRRGVARGAGVAPLQEMLDLEMALQFLYLDSAWATSHAVHSHNQYGIFLARLADMPQEPLAKLPAQE